MRIVAEFENAGDVAARFGLMRDRIKLAVERAPHEAAQAAVPAYRAVAPVRTGRLRAHIHAVGGDVIDDPTSDRGFHYEPVTRFGHRYADPDRIYPRSDRAPASVVSTRRGRQTGSRAALGPMFGGRFFRSVRRYHPASDWAERGHPEARLKAAQRFDRMIRDAINI